MGRKKKDAIADALEEIFATTYGVKEYFGNGLAYIRQMTGGEIYKDNKFIGKTKVDPIESYQNGGLFPVLVEKRANGMRFYQFMNGDGELVGDKFWSGTIGYDKFGFARVQMGIETYKDEEGKVHPVLDKWGKQIPVYAYLKKNGKKVSYVDENGKRKPFYFNAATFVDRKTGIAKVKPRGEDYFTYINLKTGQYYPHKFRDCADCSRDGLFLVQLYDTGVKKLMGAKDGTLYNYNSKEDLYWEK